MNIEWTLCSERLPPDCDSVIFRSLLTPKPYPCKSSIMMMFIMDDPQGYLAQEWTEFTKEKWEFLNR